MFVAQLFITLLFYYNIKANTICLIDILSKIILIAGGLIIKKNIKILTAVIAGISIATAIYTPAFASDNSGVIAHSIALPSNTSQGNKPIITLDKIIDATVSNSDKLELKSNEISLYRKKIKVQDQINDYYDDIGQTVYDFPYDKLKLIIK